MPLGTHIALRSDVLHSGVYGNSGNIRFHMTLKSKNRAKVDRDKLHCYNENNDKERPEWKEVFNESRTKFQRCETQHIEVLERHMGGASKTYLDCMKLISNKKRKKSK